MPLTGFVTIWQRDPSTGAAYWFTSRADAIEHGQWQWSYADPSADQVEVLDLSTLTVVWTPELATTPRGDDDACMSR